MKNLQTMKQSVQKGFTLIELMIVVAIIGILAALAIPAYTDYTIKSRVAEGASLSGAAKTGIEVYWSENGTLFKNSSSITATDIDFSGASGDYVSAVTLETGPVIQIVLKTTSDKLGNTTANGGALEGCYRYFPARTSGRNIIWSIGTTGCSGTTAIPNKYLPKT